ncbi:MAG: GTP-binding protein [Myxococcales bacterium]|nr:GTP-binding protein [Myxococcales bacterium]
MAHAPVPVTLIAGFLGSGKTTFLNHVLAGEHGRRVAVLVNDFGDVSIDAELIASADDTSVTLTNGCICCTIRDDLVRAVRDVLRREPPPEHLVVELSGIADPGSVLRSFALMEKTWPLFVDGVIALVDVEHFPEEGEPHHTLAREQLVLADVVLLNKTDLVPPDRVAELRRRITGWVPTARVVETVRGEIPLELCLGFGAEPDHPRDLGHAAEVATGDSHGFSTFTYRTPSMLALGALRATCTELPAGVFRAKGFVHLDARPDHRTVLQIVGRRARIELGEPWGQRTPETVIVFIGAREGFDRDALRAVFDACIAGPGGPGRAGIPGAISWIRQRFRAR